MNISFYNFKELHSSAFNQELLQIFAQILQDNNFIEGKYNTLFEQEFARTQGAKHCLLVANGTDAIEIALKVYDINPGDLVGIPTISYYATAEAVLNVGAIPVFVDVDPHTGLMDPTSLSRVIQKQKLKAIIPVHVYGLPADMDGLEKICQSHGIKIIEDAAQAAGTFTKKGPAGCGKNLTTFSFYPTKNLGAMGDAGAITAQDAEQAEKIIQLRNHGGKPHHLIVGRNSRCDHFQAAVLYLKLKNVQTLNEKRKKIAAQYYEVLSTLPIQLVPQEYIPLSSWHLFPIRLKNFQEKMALREHLTKQGVSTMLFYERSLPEEKPLLTFSGEKEKGIHFAAQTLCLPMHPFLTMEEIQYVGNKVREFFHS